MTNNYEDIVREWYNKLKPTFLRRLTSQYSFLTLGTAEDLYQDTFIAVQKNIMLGRVSENTSWSSYILTIGLNLASKETRKFGKVDSIDENDENDGPTGLARKVQDLLKSLPEEETPLYADPEAQALLGDELTHTPEPCGSIIRLFYYEGLSMENIAEQIGYKNATTAKSKKSQCMKDLVARVKKSLSVAGLIN